MRLPKCLRNHSIYKACSQWIARYLKSPQRPTSTEKPLQQLTLCVLNTENLFISLEHHDGSDFSDYSESEWRKLALPQLRHKQKPLNKLWGLTNAINDIQPDILMLIEVGGQESLEHFNRYFLKENYLVHFIETNSNRCIDLAFLVKKNIPLSAKTVSNRNTRLRISTHGDHHSPKRFSRDAAELHLFKDSQLKLILLLTHLKSKISTEKDFQGRDLRRAEAEALISVYHRISQQHPNVPVVVGGDFNADLESPELEIIRTSNLTDFHEILESSLEDRISFVHFDHLGQPKPQILDYLLVSPQIKNKIVKNKSFTYRYKSFYNAQHPLPTTIHQRYHMPSDHFPLVLTLDV